MAIPSAELSGSTMERSIAWNSSIRARAAGRAIASGNWVFGAPGAELGMLSASLHANYKSLSHKSLEKSLEIEMTSLSESLAQLNSIYDGLIAMKKLAETSHKNNNTYTSDDLNGINSAYIALRSAVKAIANEYRQAGPVSALNPQQKILPDTAYTVFLNDLNENVRIIISTSSTTCATGIDQTLSSSLANVTSAGNALDQLSSAVQFVLNDITKYEAAIETMDAVREMSGELHSGWKDAEGDILDLDIPELMQSIADNNLNITKALKIAGEHVTLENLTYNGIANTF